MNKEVISTRLYFELLSRPDNLTNEEQKEMLDYSNFIISLFRYSDYLLPSMKGELDNYKAEIYRLSIISDEHPDRLNESQRYEMEKYTNMMNIANESIKKRQLVKESDNAGFANAFIITGTLILTGILFGASLFFFL